MFEKMVGTQNPSHMGWIAKFCYGVGHVFNDLCASMWFSYLLVFFEMVLQFESTKAGLILLIGQLADGFSTPIVGIFSDKENKITACANYGRRKVWHLIGTLFVLVSFPFIFSPCIGCSNADQNMQLIYYSFFVILFQFGWACVQISHLSLIPELTSKKHTRTELNSIRYAFTVLSNLSVFTVAFLVLGSGDFSSTSEGSTISYNQSSTISFLSDATTTDPRSSFINPDDDAEFRNMALFCVCVGAFFSFIFHIGVKEPPYRTCKKVENIEKIEKVLELNDVPVTKRMRKTDWFKEVAFYQVALLYMSTRLYVNLYQVYIPMYVQYTLNLSRTAVASVPFTMYFAGFFGSFSMKPINKKIGRKGSFFLGCCFGLAACTWVAFGTSDAYKTWGIYCVASLLGIGGSTLLITSLSITADLIGNNVEGGAFVYGFMSLVDKFSNGIIIMIIQSASDGSVYFYKYVITYACGAACVMGILVCLSLIPVKVGHRRGIAKRLVSIVDETASPVEDEDFQGVIGYARERSGSVFTIYGTR